jgi:hypothetical protein
MALPLVPHQRLRFELYVLKGCNPLAYTAAHIDFPFSVWPTTAPRSMITHQINFLLMYVPDAPAFALTSTSYLELYGPTSSVSQHFRSVLFSFSFHHCFAKTKDPVGATSIFYLNSYSRPTLYQPLHPSTYSKPKTAFHILHNHPTTRARPQAHQPV